MCLLISISPDTLLDKELCRNGFESNPHGAGFAYVENGKIKISKGYFDFDEFWNAFDAIQLENKGAKIVHERICSVGDINSENCHPFVIDENHCIAHNGTLNFKAVDGHSDTYLFTENILKPIFERDPDFYKTLAGRYLLEECIGAWNKIAILNNEGEIVILNEQRGTWESGVWYSNESYKTKKKKKKTFTIIRKAKRLGGTFKGVAKEMARGRKNASFRVSITKLEPKKLMHRFLNRR